jgi:hypothetical protein
MDIKPEHIPAWEHVAAKQGTTVEQLAQTRLDNLAAAFEAERQQDDRNEQARLYELALQLPEEDRVELKELVEAKAVARGLIPAE